MTTKGVAILLACIAVLAGQYYLMNAKELSSFKSENKLSIGYKKSDTSMEDSRRCSEEAQKFFDRNYNGAGGINNYENSYNESRRSCYMLAKIVPYQNMTSTEYMFVLFDVYTNTKLGTVTMMINNSTKAISDVTCQVKDLNSCTVNQFRVLLKDTIGSESLD